MLTNYIIIYDIWLKWFKPYLVSKKILKEENTEFFIGKTKEPQKMLGK